MRRAGRKRQWWPISVTMATIISVGKAACDVLFLPAGPFFASPPVFLGIQRNALYSCFFRRLWRCIWRLVEAKRQRRYTQYGPLVVVCLCWLAVALRCVGLLFPFHLRDHPGQYHGQSNEPTMLTCFAGRPCPTPHARYLWSGTIRRSVV